MARVRKGVPTAPSAALPRINNGYRLTFPHGFIDEEGIHRFWSADALVLDPKDLELLRSRGVDLQEE